MPASAAEDGPEYLGRGLSEVGTSVAETEGGRDRGRTKLEWFGQRLHGPTQYIDRSRCLHGPVYSQRVPCILDYMAVFTDVVFVHQH